MGTALIILSSLLVSGGGWSRAESGRRDTPAPAPGPGRGGFEPELEAPPTTSSWTDDLSLLPILFYSPETEVGFGLAAILSLAIPEANPSVSTIAFGVIYTTEDQLIARVEPDLRFGGDAFLHMSVRYQRFPTRFFAPGADPDDEGEPYDEKTFMGHVDQRFTVGGRLRAGLRWEFRYNDLTAHVAGGVLESSGYPGLRRYFASGIGPVVSFDSRDEPRLPRRGVLAELRMIGYAGFSGADFDALRFDVDLRGYLTLSGCHVLAGQIQTQLSTGALPFQLLPRLGGPNFLRGWYEGHLRDRHAMLAQLEWRFPIWDRVGGAAFFSIGQAVADLADVSLDRLRAGGGLGLRWLLNQRQNVTVRFDLAWGSGFAAYFDVLEAF